MARIQPGDLCIIVGCHPAYACNACLNLATLLLLAFLLTTLAGCGEPLALRPIPVSSESLCHGVRLSTGRCSTTLTAPAQKHPAGMLTPQSLQTHL